MLRVEEDVLGVALLDEVECERVNGGRNRALAMPTINVGINVTLDRAVAINRGLQIAIIVLSPGATIIQQQIQNANATIAAARG